MRDLPRRRFFGSIDPKPTIKDEDDTVRYQDENRETFEVIIEVSELDNQPPWWGSRPITDIIIEGTVVQGFEYSVINGHRVPDEDAYWPLEYEDVVIRLMADDTHVYTFDAGDLGESDITWGRYHEAIGNVPAAAQNYLTWLTDNREIGGYFPEEVS